MKKIKANKKLLSSFEQEQTISKKKLKNLKGGGWGFIYKPGGICRFCDPDNSDG